MAECGYPVRLSYESGGSGRFRPCGQCLACRVNIRRCRTFRILAESQCHEHSSFGTLTYDEDHVPWVLDVDGAPVQTLRYRDVQLYFKRLRKSGLQFRYFVCGEYGDRTRRPHYHPVVFGPPADEVEDASRAAWKLSAPERVQFEPLTAQGAAYVAGYTMKKLAGADDYRLSPHQEPEKGRNSLGLGLEFTLEELTALQGRPAAVELMQSTGDVMSVVALGDRTWPLDRYMREKLREWFGRSAPPGGDGSRFRDAESLSTSRKKVRRLERLMSRRGQDGEERRRQAGVRPPEAALPEGAAADPYGRLREEVRQATEAVAAIARCSSPGQSSDS